MLAYPPHEMRLERHLKGIGCGRGL